ncbi:hypothetical protein HanOQP8_Chr09g0322611 [Helianthus annuus]|nr:hypothetical protein HanOQP8_Chr09g0322611 [Helianthus annuus]
MCYDNWGRSSFARALIEINAENELKDHIIVAIPKLDDEGYITEKVTVEYEWKPQRCSVCCVFGHDDQTCGKNVNNKAKQVVIDDDGFFTDKRKTARLGVTQKKQKPKFVYKRKANKADPSTSGTKNDEQVIRNDKPDHNPVVKVTTRNSFDALNTVEGNEGGVGSDHTKNINITRGTNDKSKNQTEEVLEVNPTEMSKFMTSNLTNDRPEGASTPGETGLHG